MTANDRARRSPSESRPGSAGGASPPASASLVDAQEKTEDSLPPVSDPGLLAAADPPDHPAEEPPELLRVRESSRRPSRRSAGVVETESESRGGVIVTVLNDIGERYFSTGIWD